MTLKTRTGSAERWLVLLSVCLAAMTMPLTFTGPAVALSRIAADLGGSPIALNWVTNAFMLTFGASLMAAGALADNHGRKRIFLSGLCLYVAASLGAMLAPDIVWFDMFRAAQGIGSAFAFAGGASALAQEFEGPLRLRAFSFLGTSFGIGLAFGPIASGLTGFRPTPARPASFPGTTTHAHGSSNASPCVVRCRAPPPPLQWSCQRSNAA